MGEPELDVLRAVLGRHYQVERELGRGGMAAVYLARDLRHHRPVAIKVILPDRITRDGTERFLREMRSAAQLTHPHILPLLDSGDVDGVPYYVMPYVQGESLRAYLRREKQLPFAEVVRIARQVADALGYAHARGIVHRDIKPANVLLEDGHAYVADFGICRALDEVEADRLTATGMAVGTPGYMSPEQAAGDAVDGRSDLYSLGCVVYEMLTGEKPYEGTSPQAILRKQLQLPVPSPRVVRDTLPPAVDAFLERALARLPVDRFRTAEEFTDALDAMPTERARVPRRRGAWVHTPAATAAGLLVAGAIWAAAGMPGFPRGEAPDTAVVAVRAFEVDEGLTLPFDVTFLVHDAMSWWGGLRVRDPAEPSSQAGRYVDGTVSRVGDSVRVRAALYAAPDDALLAAHTVRLPRDGTRADSLLAALVDRLVLRDAYPSEGGARAATRSLPARQAFAAGRAALEEWHLGRADSAFRTATTFDPQYASAHVWLAAVRAWSRAAPSTWQMAAERAERLTTAVHGEGAMARALVAQARGDLAHACEEWTGLTRREPNDFAGWLGLADCLASDDAVVRDVASPSGWRFRTSWEAALRAYRRALSLHPPILRAYREGGYRELRRLFHTAGNDLRLGRAAPPDSGEFGAITALHHDTLVLTPYPRPIALIENRSVSREEAIRRQRGLLRDVALAWTSTAPTHPDALELLAVSLWMMGDPAALDTIRAARRQARTPEQQLTLAGSEAWMQLAFALPTDIVRIARVKALADSLLAAYAGRPASDALLLAGLAALTGRAGAAAGYVRDPRAASRMSVPEALRGEAGPLLVHAALGGPPDTLERLARRVSLLIDEALLPGVRSTAVSRWLVRPATLAFPNHVLSGLGSYYGLGDYLLDLQVDHLRQDTAAVRERYEWIRGIRANILPATLTFDAIYPEAAVLAAMGHHRAAADWLDPVLRTVSQKAPHVLTAPERAASLVQAMALRARVAERLEEPEMGRQWAAVVVTLWADADPHLQPSVARLRKLLR